MTAPATPKAPLPNHLLDYDELAAWLNTSVRHLRRLVDEHRIPFKKVGRKVRFDPEEIKQWLDSNSNAVPAST